MAGIDAQQFRELIIRPVLYDLSMYSQAAENLLMGTAAQESGMGRYLRQLGSGPALGPFQMEPATHEDIWRNYLIGNASLGARVRQLAGYRWVAREIPAKEMVGNLYYAAAMCRLHYRRRPEPLPDAEDIEGLARYWKRHYNTPAGRGTVAEFMDNYQRFMAT